jgi:hypothetical protein
VPLGALNQPNSKTYYQQTKVLTTGEDAKVSGTAVTTSAGTRTLCDNYGKSGGPGGDARSEVRAPTVGMGVFDLQAGTFLGTVAAVTSPNRFRLSRSPGDRAGRSLLISSYGGCGPADYFRGGLGVSSGNPRHRYWDNCIWGSRDVTIAGNSFSTDAHAVRGCTEAAQCGVMAAVAFNAGVPELMQFFNSYQEHIAVAASGLGNVWSKNAYRWSGGGAGQWRFQAGPQGVTVSRSQWQGSHYGQDSGSTFRQS